VHVAAHEVRVEGDEIQVRLASEGEPEHKLQ
jgi:hypothetical protein